MKRGYRLASRSDEIAEILGKGKGEKWFNIPIIVLVLLVDAAHERGGRRQDLVDEDEDGLLRGELDALADYINELTNGQIGRDKIFLLVDGSDIALLDFFADDLFLVM